MLLPHHFSFVNDTKNILRFSSVNKHSGQNYFFLLNIELKSCPCSYYLDKKICQHLLAASRIFNFDISSEKTFVVLKKKGRPKGAPKNCLIKLK